MSRERVSSQKTTSTNAQNQNPSPHLVHKNFELHILPPFELLNLHHELLLLLEGHGGDGHLVLQLLDLGVDALLLQQGKRSFPML